ncbi:MAG: glycosyltransferase [Candidatus Sumerlaeia bacterium]|nr:glycosyltransferase [Candidatus Sumerlaeia bacterium]
MDTTCAVIILTARRLPLLEKCLASLVKQTRLPDKVFVVCTDPSDGSGEWVSGHDCAPLSVEVVPMSPRGSFAEARNQGIRKAETEWIAFLDDDCEADPHWLERLLANAGEGNLEAVGGMVLPADELEAPDNYHPDLCWAVGLLPEAYLGPLGGRRILPSTSNLMAKTELFRSQPFQEIGGRDGDYYSGREDADWWRQIRRSGYRTGVARRALVWHHVPQERLDPDVLMDRLRADGEAHWVREHNSAHLSAACRDVITAPIGALLDWSKGSLSLGEAWANRRGWATRQVAWMRAAVDDFSPDSINPMQRTEGLFLQGGELLGEGIKATARHVLSYGVESWRGSAREHGLEDLPEHPLVVLHDNLGDAVLALPMIQQLAKATPGGRVTVLCGKAGHQILEATLPENVTVFRLPSKTVGNSPRALRAMHQLLTDIDADVQILAYAHGLSPAPFFAHRAPIVAWTRDNGLERHLWRSQIDFPVEKSWEKSEVTALLDLLAPLGISTRLEAPSIEVGSEFQEWRDDLLNEHPPGARGYAVVQAETNIRYKDWPLERALELADRLTREGLRVFLVGGGEAESIACGGNPAITPLHGQLDGMELAALLEEAECFVGVDSGPGHLAHAVGCPLVLLFGRTTPHRWAPLPRLRKETGTRPDFFLVFPGNSDWLDEELTGLPLNHGVDLISVDQVFGKCMELLEEERN